MRRSVLLVESEPGVRALLRIQLRLLGVPVVEAPSGRAGLAALPAHLGEIAAVISGELGPPVDGAALLAGLRALDPDVPVLFFLAHSLPADVLYQPRVGVFEKPHGLGDLCRAAADVVAGAVAAPG
jgi:DNA-binding NtrC family response regulator